MKDLKATNQLLDEVAKLNRTFEASGIMLAVGLVKVHDSEAFKEAGYDTWPDYYRNELGRERSVISKMLTAGRWIIENNVAESNVTSYQKLASAIVAHPNEAPEKVLAIAATWTPDDFKAHAKDECPGPDLDMSTVSAKCRNCGMWHPYTSSV